MKIQDYIDHLKAIGATFVNMEADVVATLPNLQIMITACQLDDNDKVIYGNDYSDIVGDDTTPTAFLTDVKGIDGWECLADTTGFIEICDLEN